MKIMVAAVKLFYASLLLAFITAFALAFLGIIH